MNMWFGDWGIKKHSNGAKNNKATVTEESRTKNASKPSVGYRNVGCFALLPSFAKRV